MKVVLIVFAVIFGHSVFSQIDLPGPINVTPTGQINGGYIPENIPTKRMIPYEHVREADVVWSKRVWRALDMRERLNHPIFYPLDEVTPYDWQRNSSRWSLWTIIRKHVMNGDLRVFSPYNPASYGLGAWDGDQMKYPIDPTPGDDFYSDSVFRDQMVYYLGRLGPQGTVPIVDEYGDPLIVYDEDGNSSYVYDAPDTLWYNSEDIIEYRVKEDWFFDKERSKLDVRIIAIAPVVYDIEIAPDGSESIRGKKELFWLYFPHCRYVFNNYFTYNDRNDAQWMSFDDLFWKRRFSSYIYKESNVHDRKIDDYSSGVEALHESDKITNEVRNLEHDLWSF